MATGSALALLYAIIALWRAMYTLSLQHLHRCCYGGAELIDSRALGCSKEQESPKNSAPE